MQTLQVRGCQIPQIQRRKRNNVIQGSFLRPGQTDWAVLCTTKKITELLVFENESADHVTVIASSPNGFYKWTISPITAQDFPDDWRSKNKKPLHIEHDSVNSYIEYGDPDAGCFYCYSAEGDVLYFDQGQWIKAADFIAN